MAEDRDDQPREKRNTETARQAKVAEERAEQARKAVEEQQEAEQEEARKAAEQEAKFESKQYVSPDGRVERWVTSPEEAKELEDQGFEEGELKGRDAETKNSGREGNLRAAASSTTRTGHDGIDRPGTSEK